jgi:polyisoprenoid-binding protein YceI
MTATNQTLANATTQGPAEIPAQASYAIDASHSRAAFAVKHMMVSTVRGDFSGLSGTVVLDEAEPARSRVEATIDARTVNTGVEMRDNHLRSPDFFDVEKFPTIRFVSTKVQKLDAENYAVTGDLTMHGVTRHVVLDVESPALELKDPYGNTKRGATATLTVNRKDYGLNWNTALEAGGVLVGESVRVTIDLQLVRK